MAAEEQPADGAQAGERFDVFLSHNTDDKPLVRDLAEQLTQRGVRVWVDENELIPGRPWQEELERILTTCKSAAVLVGPNGLGPWQAREMRLALAEFVNRGLPVIPVLLPGVTKSPELPAFLRQLTWVDLREGIQPKHIDKLVWGITGRKHDSCPPDQTSATEPEPAALTSRVVITLHGIRTRGAWQKSLGDALNGAGFITETLDFGYFSALKLLLPSSRRRMVLWFRDQYAFIRQKHKGTTPSIVAHSFATYLATKAIETFPGDVQFDRVILCGSIVRCDYPWSQAHDHGLFRRGLNDYGRQDVWSRAVEWVVPDAGASGHRGFLDHANGALLQQERDFRHSDYFYTDNYKLRWIPFLLGRPLSALPVLSRPGVNWRFATAACIATLFLTAVLWLIWLRDATKGTTEFPASVGDTRSSGERELAPEDRIKLLSAGLALVDDVSRPLSHRALALSECITNKVLSDDLAFISVAKLVDGLPSYPEDTVANAPLLSALTPLAPEHLDFVAEHYSSNTTFWWMAFQAALKEHRQRCIAFLSKSGSIIERFPVFNKLCANLPDDILQSMRDSTCSGVRALAAFQQVTRDRDSREAATAVLRTVIAADDESGFALTTGVLKEATRLAVLDTLIAKRCFDIVVSDGEPVKLQLQRGPDVDTSKRSMEFRFTAAKEYLVLAAKHGPISQELLGDLVTIVERYELMMQAMENTVASPNEDPNGDLTARACIEALLSVNSLTEARGASLDKRAPESVVNVLEKVFAHSGPVLWRANLNHEAAAWRSATAERRERVPPSLPTLDVKGTKLVLAPGKEVVVRDVKLAADGTMTATFSIGNDELLFGFKAAVGLELQDSSGAMLSYIDCGHLEIGGKPPGRAIWQDKLWSGVLPAIARSYPRVSVVLKATKL